MNKFQAHQLLREAFQGQLLVFLTYILCACYLRPRQSLPVQRRDSGHISVIIRITLDAQ